MTISILHISDLHRDPTQGIRNGPLLRSLINDRDRYVLGPPPIPHPSLIVVSGDIVYGVPASHPSPADALFAQYREAEEFLAALVDAFLNGDTERLILVPGNHDVSFPDTLASLELLPTTASPTTSSFTDAIADLFSPHSGHRWSWKDLRLYRLAHIDRYNRRLELFADLYDRFYKGTRTYSLEPHKQFDIFSFPALAVVVASFNSCYNNDPFHKAGCIHPDAIAEAARTIDSLRLQGHVPIAVWHHNTAGGPHSDDYMDADTLQVLIDCGFSIGLHGHQHRPMFIDERFRFATRRKITVISAGTLCGGSPSLPHGQDRSYNVIELDPLTSAATVHQRRMVNDTFATPVWSAGWFSESNASAISFEVQRPAKPQTAQSRLAAAESLIATSEYGKARDILLPLAVTDGIARRLLLECYASLPYDVKLIACLFPPQSLSEAVFLADALWEMQDNARLRELFQSPLITNSSDPVATDLRQKYEARLK